MNAWTPSHIACCYYWLTFDSCSHSRCQTDAIKVVIVNLVILNGPSPSIRHLDPSGLPSEDPVLSQHGTTSRAYEDSGEGVVEDVILFEQASARVEDTDTPFLAVVDLVSSEDGVGLRLDPHASQRIAVNVIFHQEAFSGVVDQHTTILASKDLVLLNHRVTASSAVEGREWLSSMPRPSHWYSLESSQ